MVVQPMMVMLMVLGSLLPGQEVRWAYRPAGSFRDPGPCESAGRIGETLALACHQGIWLGTEQDLRLVLQCPAEPEQPNRVRILDGGHFLATLPCGLFVIEPKGGWRRMLFLEGSGAVDTDGAGRAVLWSSPDLFEWTPDSARKRLSLACQEEDTEPTRIEVAGRRALVDGTWQIDLGNPGSGCSRVRDPGRTLLLRDGRLLSIDPDGNLVLGTRAMPVRLPLRGADRILSLARAGQGAVVFTARRWYQLDPGGLRTGRLPAPAAELVVVDQLGGRGPPWLAGPGSVYRPELVPEEAVQARCALPPLDGLLQAAYRAQALSWPEPPPAWIRLVPRLSLQVAGSRRHGTSPLDPGGQQTVTERSLTFLASLSWDFGDDSLGSAESDFEGLRRVIAVERLDLKDRLLGALQSWQERCQESRAEPRPPRENELGRAESAALLGALLGPPDDRRMPWLDH